MHYKQPGTEVAFVIGCGRKGRPHIHDEKEITSRRKELVKCGERVFFPHTADVSFQQYRMIGSCEFQAAERLKTACVCVCLYYICVHIQM